MRTRRPTLRIALDCACGDTARGRVSPPAAYAGIKAAFIAVHGGDGCRVTDLNEEVRPCSVPDPRPARGSRQQRGDDAGRRAGRRSMPDPTGPRPNRSTGHEEGPVSAD